MNKTQTVALGFFKTSILMVFLFLSGCVSPYQADADRLHELYRNGDITAAEHHNGMMQIRQLEQQRNYGIGQAIMQNTQQYNQNQQRIYQQQMNSFRYQQPRYQTGTIMTPSGQIYNYNSTTY